MQTLATYQANAKRAYLIACGFDIMVRKPGNVAVGAPGHGMDAALFVQSAKASADAIVAVGTRVGERIERAVRATHDAVGCNTNLGIVLLCAPLAAAAEWSGTHPWPRDQGRMVEDLRAVLAALDVDDARAAYRAIALANPGGIGKAAAQDVFSEPTVGLRTAMQLAAKHDRIARQYANGYDDIVDLGVPSFVRAIDPAYGMLAAFISFLATDLDSHIVRKHGAAVAQSVTDEANRVMHEWANTSKPPTPDALAAWDERLKAQSINPGTCADLSVASAFMAMLADPHLCDHPVAGLAWNVLNTRPTLTRLSG